ncbi:hypothetical protein [Labrys monachus]|uniref:Uncharacterized protein n=1 Tax=Labrys monachus TaxID=217067 RepID=A0ABU0FCL7_9HYPH|nr:hypothetical protein [Labrys monachus]MDQ0391800.1 hypothetical protein [Labrys monachus]
MANVWVYKEDGTMQCGMGNEISLEEMRGSLTEIVGSSSIISEEKRMLPLLRPALCGTPTGAVNAYELTEDGAYILFKGFVGPRGFKLWVWPAPSDGRKSLVEDRPVPWPFPWSHSSSDIDVEGLRANFANFISSLTQVGSQPTQILDLQGRRCRYYKQGDSLTMDFIPSRVNIEHDDANMITRIWFG